MTTGRRLVLRLVTAALIVLLVVSVATRLWPEGGASIRPVRRILLVTIDTLRADALPFYGNPRVEARSLSRLSRQSVVFERAQSTSPWTRPSIMSILTGLSPAAHGANVDQVEVEALLPESVPTLAECMQRAGYRTGAIGYNPFLASSVNLRRGFQDYWYPPQAAGDADDGAGNGRGRALPMTEEAEKAFEEGRRSGDWTRALTRISEHWIRNHAEEDFFLWIHYYDPHAPYTPLRSDYAKLVDYEPPEGQAYLEWRKGILDGFYVFLALERTKLSAELQPDFAAAHRTLQAIARGQTECLRALYHAEVEYVDRAIGRLTNLLEESGLFDDTLIVVTSDHGEEFLEHDHLEHGHSFYEELIRVPLVVKLPGARAGRRVEQRVSNQSLFPTLLELCGIAPLPHASECPSLASLLRTGDASSLSSFLTADSILYGESGVAIVFGDKKYVLRTKSGCEELYDLAADPGETTSLVSRDHQGLAEARGILTKWRRSTAALKKKTWALGLRTTEENEKTRELLRGHGYLK